MNFKFKRLLLLMAVLTGFFVSPKSPAAEVCSSATAKVNFLKACVGSLTAERAIDSATATGSTLRPAKSEDSVCRCIADAYTVEKAAKPPSCDYKLTTVDAVIRDSHRKTSCH